jgi:hypothetical protein
MSDVNAPVIDRWISAETEPKEYDFRGILNMHVPVCKGIISRSEWAHRSYLYVDLYAGPGHLRVPSGRIIDGSPLIARDVLTRHGLPYHAVHFEQDADTAARLGEALWVPASLLDIPDPGSSPVITASCQEGFPAWLAVNGAQRNRFGLVYADPIRDEIPVALFNSAAARLPRVDLLSYVSATQYKRRGRVRLAEHVRAVGKKHALIRAPREKWQFTFILWSDWGELPEWNQRGFYRLDSERGRQILDQLNLTAREWKEKANTPLPLEPPYRSYAEYLKHPEFLKVRAEVFARAAGTCERCGQRPPTEPHHLRYPPWGTFDVPGNLLAICHLCHCEIHGKAT